MPIGFGSSQMSRTKADMVDTEHVGAEHKLPLLDPCVKTKLDFMAVP